MRDRGVMVDVTELAKERLNETALHGRTVCAGNSLLAGFALCLAHSLVVYHGQGRSAYAPALRRNKQAPAPIGLERQ